MIACLFVHHLVKSFVEVVRLKNSNVWENCLFVQKKERGKKKPADKQKMKGTLNENMPMVENVSDANNGLDDNSFDGLPDITTDDDSFREADSLLAKDKEQELESEEEEGLQIMGEHREVTVEMRSGTKIKELQLKVRFWFGEDELPEGQDKPGYGKPEWCGALKDICGDVPELVREYVKEHLDIAHYFEKHDKELKAMAQEHKKQQKAAMDKKKKEAKERKQVSALWLLNELEKPCLKISGDHLSLS